MNTEQEFCPNCETERPVIREVVRERYEIRGESVESDHERLRCRVCDTDFATGEMMERNLEGARAVYRARHGIFSPAEIRGLRSRYGASQKAFGTILGFGELTINSYERGALPTEANNNLLKLVRDPDTFRILYQENRGRIGPTQRRRIESRLFAGNATKGPDPMQTDSIARFGEPPCSDPIYHGFAPRTTEKMFALIQLVLACSTTALYKMQLLKTLFYIDFAHFRRCTVSITGWNYAAIDYGPVPNDYKEILSFGEQRRLFLSHPDDRELGDLYELPPGFDLSEAEATFSSEELETVRAVTESLRGKTAAELRELTHQEKAWTRTPRAECISYEWAMELSGV